MKESNGGAETQTGSKVLPSQKAKVSSVKIHIIKERCKQCNLCIDFCPRQVLQQSDEVNKKGYHIPEQIEEPEKGKICLACATHSAIGQMPLELKIFDHNKKLLKTLRR